MLGSLVWNIQLEDREDWIITLRLILRSGVVRMWAAREWLGICCDLLSPISSLDFLLVRVYFKVVSTVTNHRDSFHKDGNLSSIWVTVALWRRTWPNVAVEWFYKVVPSQHFYNFLIFAIRASCTAYHSFMLYDFYNYIITVLRGIVTCKLSS
jgi:hypothetical protein